MTNRSIKPASRTSRVAYAIRDIVVLAEKVARQGKEMLYLNIGDPNLFDFRTPPHIIEATYRALRENQNGYAPSSGVPEAREAIAREAQRKGIRSVRDVFVTTGATEAIDICFAALADRGENLLIPSPGYPTYSAILNKFEVEPRNYVLDEGNRWQPALEDIEKKIDRKTRGIVLINPNNPTGALCDEETVRGIVRLALKHNLVIFSDEIYDRLILDGGRYASPAALDADVPVVTLSGLSKNYLAPGFRVGWAVISGDARVLGGYLEGVNKLLRARLCANHPEQWAIRPALEGDQSHLAETTAKLSRRRDLTVKMLNSIPGITCVKPEGAFYAYPRIELPISDDDFVRRLIEECGVVTVPGTGFGQAKGTKHFRVVFLPPEDVLEKAYRKIAAFCRLIS